jgi:hypothetical protein
MTLQQNINFIPEQYVPFPTVHMRYLVFLTKIIHHLLPSQAQLRLQRILPIVQARMDHLCRISHTFLKQYLCMTRYHSHSCRKRAKEQHAHTSEFLELVSVPTALCFSIKTVLAPSLDCSFRATASPTAPAPITACVKSALRGALVENNLERGIDFAMVRENIAKRVGMFGK